ncbi:MAG: ATP-dependent endonuclease [Polyangiales bacterium]
MSGGFTALVGPNNSGKSSLLKSIFECRTLLRSFSTGSGNLQEALMGRAVAANLDNLLDPVEVFHGSSIDLSVGFSLDPEVGTQAGQISHLTLSSLRSQPGSWSSAPTWTGQALQLDPKASPSISGGIINHDGKSWSVTPLIKAFEKLSRVLYFGAFRNAITDGANDHYDMPVGAKFIRAWHDWKTGASKQKNEQVRRVTADIRRILGFRELDISASVESSSLTIATERSTCKLQEMGSGLAQLVLCLGQAAVSRPSFIFIDEPELHLHPSLQADFVTALASYTEDGVAFATHSMGLARAIADRIYVCRQSEGVSTCTLFEETPHFAALLGEMGLSAYQAIDFNCVLLVEGVTDVRVVKQWLRLLDKEHRVLVMPLGGGAMIRAGVEHELAELTRLGVNVFALVDSERTAAGEPVSPAHESFRSVCERDLKFNVHITSRRATENYFTDAAVRAVFGPNRRALGEFESLKEHPQAWRKQENWRAARAMTLADLQATDVGQFLAKL